MKVEEVIGVKLTKSFAMDPASSVCGIYFAHPNSCYFSVGKIHEDQVISLFLFLIQLVALYHRVSN